MDVCFEVRPPFLEECSLKVEECTSDEQLEDLRGAWTRLWSQCPRATPFLFNQFIRLHRACWRARGQKGILDSEQLLAFHREAAWNLLSMGALRLYALTFRDQVAAILYGFSHAGRAFYYLGGFDPELAEFSPGTVIIGHAIEQAIEEGAGEFDFLRGREAYKYLWGAKGRLNYRRQFWHAQAA